MFNLIRDSFALRLFWGVIGMHLLNTSVDVQDANPDYIAEDLSINDQESIIEIVIEKILGFENAIAEYDDRDTDESKKQSLLKFELKIKNEPLSICYNEASKARPNYGNYLLGLSSGYLQFSTPPPESDLNL